MVHYFDIEIAEKYGMAAAVVYGNIQHWTAKNKANEKNFHDGRYWTYNSIPAFQKLFPYLSEKQIRTALKTLTDAGLIFVGCFNEDPFDKTNWYSCNLVENSEGSSMRPTGQLDAPHRADRLSPQGESIYPTGQTDFPYKTNNKLTDSKRYPPISPQGAEEVETAATATETSEEETSAYSSPAYQPPENQIPVEQVVEDYNSICVSFPKARLSHTLMCLVTELQSHGYTLEDVQTVFRMAEESNFLKRGFPNGGKASILWLLTLENFDKILSGAYENGGDDAYSDGGGGYNGYTQQNNNGSGRKHSSTDDLICDDGRTFNERFGMYDFSRFNV